MKSIKINHLSLLWLLLCISTTTFIACDDANDWPIEKEYDALFRPLDFETSSIKATEVEIKFNRIVEAGRYIFEFSEDSLEFNNIVKEVVILADTLTPFSTSTTVTKIEYRLLFDDLKGNTQYSVRMRGENEGNTLRSEYVYEVFRTSAENIFTNISASVDGVTLEWTPTDRVTHILLKVDKTGEIITEKELTSQEIANGSIEIGGLEMGTYYTVTIYNNDAERGTSSFKTPGTAGAENYEVQEGDDIAEILAAYVQAGKTNINLVFESGKTYNIGELSIPDYTDNLTFTTSSTDGELPILNMNKVSLKGIMSSLNFEYVDLRGESRESNRFIDTKIGISEITFEGCNISEYNSVVRLQNETMSVQLISFNNCWIKETGGYGVMNVAGSNVSLKEIIVKNSTLTDIGTQLTDVRTSVQSVTVSNCTFVNISAKLNQVYRFDANSLPLSVETEKCIFAGPNAAAYGEEPNAINATYGDYSKSLDIRFDGSYKTSDLTVNKYAFTGITLYEGTVYELFTDPDNGDFTIKEGAGFAGAGAVGDPRWFK